MNSIAQRALDRARGIPASEVIDPAQAEMALPEIVITGAKNSGRRFILSRTNDHGKTKEGWIKINTPEHQVLGDAGNELDQFKACASLYATKEQRPHVDRHHIRGPAGKWKGVAFPARASHGRVATQNADNKYVSRHIEVQP